MNLKVEPAATLSGKIDLPASKSYSIRAFLIAACGGSSRIINPSDCDDALVALKVARSLASGKKISKIDVGESGTVLRLLLPLLALRKGSFVVTGQGTLRGRPNLFLTKALRKMGAGARGTGPKESVPIRIQGGKLRGGRIEIDGTLSSQFISALLLACPLLPQDTEIVITGPKPVSTTYITMTIQILAQAGIKIKRQGPRSFIVKGSQRYGGLKNFIVPSDYGLAAFFMTAAALIPSKITLNGALNDRFVQADGQILGFLKKMGVRFSKTSSTIKMTGPVRLKGGDFSLKDSPDLVPIMAVAALFAKGRTRLLDVKHARAKESDRISDLRHELLKIGADVRETANALIIHPRPRYRMNTVLDPHRDHRLAMAFSILGLKLGVTVKDINCTAKSYPGFVNDLKKLHRKLFLS